MFINSNVHVCNVYMVRLYTYNVPCIYNSGLNIPPFWMNKPWQKTSVYRQKTWDNYITKLSLVLL